MTPKQQRFVLEYLVDLNATQAAIRAGYSAATAYSSGHENLSKPEIAVAIAAEQAKRQQRLEVSADRVVQEYARIAFASMGDFVKFGPDRISIRDMAELTPDQLAAVGEVTETKTQTGGTVRFKLHDKIAALNALAKHLGLNAPDKLALTNTRGEDVETDIVTLARQSCFLLAKAQAELDRREAGDGRALAH